MGATDGDGGVDDSVAARAAELATMNIVMIDDAVIAPNLIILWIGKFFFVVTI